MEITKAKYNKVFGTDINDTITATIDGENWSIPIDPTNRFYAEIKRQVDAGELTIEEAE